MNEKIYKLKLKIIRLLKPDNWVMIGADEYADLRAKAIPRKQAVQEEVHALTREALTMKQLGSYVPSFEVLAEKDDTFKNSLGMICSNLLRQPEWKYLMDHLKQDQVNISLFSEEKTFTDPWVRGSINGIYVVEEQVRLLGNGFDDRKKKGLIPNEKKEGEEVKS